MNPKDFFYNFGRAIYHIDAVYNEFAKKSGVAPTLLWILYALNDGENHTQREICVDWGLPKSTVNTVVSEMKQNGYIELEPIKGKRREMTILLTEKGKQYADTVLKDIYEKEAEVFSAFTTDDLGIPDRLENIVNLLKR